MKHHDHAIRQHGQEGPNSSVPRPIHYEYYKLLTNYFIYIWAVPRDPHPLLGGPDYTKILFHEYPSASLYKHMFQIIAK